MLDCLCQTADANQLDVHIGGDGIHTLFRKNAPTEAQSLRFLDPHQHTIDRTQLSSKSDFPKGDQIIGDDPVGQVRNAPCLLYTSDAADD